MKQSNQKHKILITGSAGFMGSHLYDYLFKRGHEVYGIDDLSGGFLRNVSQKKFFTKLDLRDRKKTGEYIKKIRPEIIFHLAADATEGRSQFTPFSAIDRNLVAYMNVLVPAIKYGLKKVILTSSMAVYGAQQVPFHEKMLPLPEDVYGIAKRAMEKATRVLAAVHGFKYVILRPHNVYGPRQNMSDPYRNVITIFINAILWGKNFYIYGDGKQKRAFSYIDDVTPAIANAAFNKKCENQIINVGSDIPMTVNELAFAVLEKLFGNKIPKRFLPKYLPLRPQEVKYAYCDHSLAKKLMHLEEKTSFRKGLKKTIEWAKKLGPQPVVYLKEMDLDHPSIPKTWKEKLL